MTRVAAMKPKMREDLAVYRLDGEAVVYDERSGELHHLNPAAAVAFDCFDGTGTVREIAADVAEAWELPPQTVERHLRAVLREFKTKGLVDGQPVLLAQPAETTDVRPA